MIVSIIEISIALIALIASIYFFKSNKKSEKEQSEKNEQNIKQLQSEKISSEKNEEIISKFVNMYDTSKDKGISALIKSGIKEIHIEHDIQYILTEIQNRTGKDPLGRYRSKIEQRGVLNFFQEIDLANLKTIGGIEKVLDKNNN